MERSDHDALDDETPLNPTSNPTFRSILAARLSRRGFIAGAGAGLATLEAALAHTRAGRVEAALAAYRSLLGDARSGAAAHLNAANELVRWLVAVRLTAAQEPIRVPDADLAPVRPTALFTDWVRLADGRWEPMESVVAPPAPPADGRLLMLKAQRYYDQALTLGAGAAARIGLASLALENGDTGEAAGTSLRPGRSIPPCRRHC